MLNLDSEAQVYGSTFTFCYGHLKKVILLVKVATVQSVLLLAVVGKGSGIGRIMFVLNLEI